MYEIRQGMNQADVRTYLERLAEVERKQMVQRREHQKMLETVMMEQRRQAAEIKQINENVAKLTERVKLIDMNLESLNERLCDLCTLLDYYMAEQEKTVPGGKEYAKWQEKIVAKKNQIAVTDQRIQKAESDKREAYRKMEVTAWSH